MDRDISSSALETVPLNDNGAAYHSNRSSGATMGGSAIFNPMGPTFPSAPSPIAGQQHSTMDQNIPLTRPTSLPQYNNAGASRHSAPNSLTSPVTPGSLTSPMSENGAALMRSNSSKMDTIKTWSISTYKCTKQLLSEKLGKSSRTVDSELEGKIESLRDTQRKYSQILRLARALSSHFHHVVQTQQQLGDAFADLSQKSPELQEEFIYNAETQRSLTKNGETLLSALNFFVSSVNTLCNKTMEDTLLTVKLFEQARIEFDAYRSDLEALSQQPRAEVSSIKLEESQLQFNAQKNKYDNLRADVAVKLKFLEENKVKVMHKQLLLFHNAICAYFTGNQSALEATLKQFNIKMCTPNSSPPSWLEQNVPETFQSIFAARSNI